MLVPGLLKTPLDQVQKVDILRKHDGLYVVALLTEHRQLLQQRLDLGAAAPAVDVDAADDRLALLGLVGGLPGGLVEVDREFPIQVPFNNELGRPGTYLKQMGHSSDSSEMLEER